MFYLINDVLINTKEIEHIKVHKFPDIDGQDKIMLRIEFRCGSKEDIKFETEEEAREELEKMHKKLNKPF